MTLIPAAPAARHIPRGLRRVRERFVAGNRIHLLHDGREAFPAMLAAIDAAERQVLLEMYWFDSDRIGRRFAEALTRAVQRGVEVAVIYDAVGSFGADPAQFEALERAGVHVVEFNPVAPWKRRFRLARLTRRDHRKILVIDGQVGFTGGINIADEWLPEEEDGGNFRDDMVRVEGPAVWGFLESFQRTYRRAGGTPLRHTPPRSPMLEVSVGEIEPRTARGKAVVEPVPDPDEADEVEALAQAAEEPSADQHVLVLGERFRRRDGSISRAYLSRMYRARQRIWLTNSYFIPDRSVVRALIRAARRGVDVRVLLPAKSDVRIADFASRAVWAKLMRNGVRIFAWTRGVLHSKTAVIDGAWSTIGTFNLDHLSLRVNLEVNVSVLDTGFASEVESVFLSDLEFAREIDPKLFRYRPLGERLIEQFAYRLRKWM